ncbi:sensor histidine kinase [Marinospirillum alkaliphilum]|uniref:histidine kinase n=1 Tax=Marinospirillum alkaliphilum DSM 21637 TaxID=1122209 RepID=A0A1K1Y3V2_9GAMM|nr:PhnD/SsuA/transferrin family substrate-binding protein [Marinospirillum alkaliphilum]SFX56536.1 two-component system, LuxR family, sensor histidine kinase TtrS [Marinospirillum alkaliphilum DSM 21637]
MKRTSVGLVALMLLLLSVGLQARDLYLGVLDWRDAPDGLESWQPTLDALQQGLSGYQLHLQMLDLSALQQALAVGQLDFVITNPGHYVELSRDYPLAPLATLLNPLFDPPHQAVGSVVLVRRDAAIHGWQDLRQRRVAAVSPQAFGGYQLIRDQLEQRGLNAEQHIGEWLFTGYPMEQLLLLLQSGEVDAVVLRSCLPETLIAEGRLDADWWRVLEPQKVDGYPCQLSSDLYPDWPFLSVGIQPPDLLRQVVVALLQTHSEQGLPEWSAPLSYQPVHTLFARLRLGPYAGFSGHSLLALIHTYRYFLLFLVILFVAGLAHYLRVQVLIRRRTAELQLAMQQSRERQQELTHLSRFSLMGELATGLAHELNQPLTAIVNYAQGSQRLLQKLPADAIQQQLHDAARHMAAQGERAAEIIRHLRGFLRKEVPQSEWLDPDQVFCEAIELMEGRLRQTEVKVDWQLCGALPLIQVSRVELLQVLINLLANAVDAMTQLTAARRTLLLSSRLTAEGNIQLDVEDHGEGLNMEVQQRLFEPFFTTKASGMGLGLSLCLNLIEQMGGQLFLFNREMEGCCARIQWPADAFAGMKREDGEHKND